MIDSPPVSLSEEKPGLGGRAAAAPHRPNSAQTGILCQHGESTNPGRNGLVQRLATPPGGSQCNTRRKTRGVIQFRLMEEFNSLNEPFHANS